MKIYFAGSIRGGREDKELYLKIIERLRQYGEVLTEHVGDPKLTSYGETVSNKHIHDRDIEWLEQSDYVVAETTCPSLGVGYEISKAEELGKPILCLYRSEDNKRLSPMISGSDKVTVSEYKELDEIDSALEKFFGKK